MELALEILMPCIFKYENYDVKNGVNDVYYEYIYNINFCINYNKTLQNPFITQNNEILIYTILILSDSSIVLFCLEKNIFTANTINKNIIVHFYCYYCFYRSIYYDVPGMLRFQSRKNCYSHCLSGMCTPTVDSFSHASTASDM